MEEGGEPVGREKVGEGRECRNRGRQDQTMQSWLLESSMAGLRDLSLC